jgi:glycosyltransferase involved in cell wall biosynthesis
MLLDMPKTAIVVPCYNEAARLNLEQFAAALSTYPWIYLYFVDDGSSDNTFNLLQQFTESNPERIKLLKLAKNSGKAAAVRHGMLAGVADGHALAGF